MTRDEAIAIGTEMYHRPVVPDQNQTAAQVVNMLEAFGLLKLDEPKAAKDQFFEKIQDHFGSVAMHDVAHWLSAAGLKIVEKAK